MATVQVVDSLCCRTASGGREWKLWQALPLFAPNLICASPRLQTGQIVRRVWRCVPHDRGACNDLGRVCVTAVVIMSAILVVDFFRTWRFWCGRRACLA